MLCILAFIFEEGHLEMFLKILFFFFFHLIVIGTEVQNEVENFQGCLFLKYCLRPHGFKPTRRFFFSFQISGVVDWST